MGLFSFLRRGKDKPSARQVVEPEIGYRDESCPVVLDCYDFSNIPYAVNDTDWTRAGESYLSGRNYATVMEAFREVGESIKSAKSRAELREDIALRLLWFDDFSIDALKRGHVMKMMHNLDFDIDMFDDDYTPDMAAAEIDDDEEVVDVNGIMDYGRDDRLEVLEALLNKSGKVEEMELTYEYEDGKGNPKMCFCRIERKSRGGYKAAFDIC